jgi:hypothetical protein
MTDEEIAREFFRRFAPVKVLFGDWDKQITYAEHYEGAWVSGVSCQSSDEVAHHDDGADSFVDAVTRAKSLV